MLPPPLSGVLVRGGGRRGKVIEGFGMLLARGVALALADLIHGEVIAFLQMMLCSQCG